MAPKGLQNPDRTAGCPRRGFDTLLLRQTFRKNSVTQGVCFYGACSNMDSYTWGKPSALPAYSVAVPIRGSNGYIYSLFS